MFLMLETNGVPSIRYLTFSTTNTLSPVEIPSLESSANNGEMDAQQAETSGLKVDLREAITPRRKRLEMARGVRLGLIIPHYLRRLQETYHLQLYALERGDGDPGEIRRRAAKIKQLMSLVERESHQDAVEPIIKNAFRFSLLQRGSRLSELNRRAL